MPHDRCPSPRLSGVPARRPAARDRRGNAASRSGGRRCRPARGHRAVQRLSACRFGWGVCDGKVLPRWLATGGLAAGAVAMALALVFREDTKADQAAFVLPVLWQLVTGAVGLLLSARPETDDAPGPAVRRVGTA